MGCSAPKLDHKRAFGLGEVGSFRACRVGIAVPYNFQNVHWAMTAFRSMSARIATQAYEKRLHGHYDWLGYGW